jgi:hypothetical protein
MLSTLNAHTRQVVEAILRGEPPSIGGKPLDPFGPEEVRLLGVLAANLAVLHEEVGAKLAQKVVELFEEPEGAAKASPPSPGDGAAAQPSWKLSKLRACSFRGLAPAGCVWHHDFAGKSHLFYGPNASGKSSLLGAVTWCLTGRIYRDDRPPSPPEEVPVYTAKRKSAGTRSDGLTLTDKNGVNTARGESYWVDLQLEDGAGGRLWVQRHSLAGLARSADGVTWVPVSRLEEVGISELDTELHLLMPARVPHLRFGKDPDLVHLFSQVVGLDDLEEIAELAGKVSMACTREVSRIDRQELAPIQATIAESVGRLTREAPETVRSLPTFLSAVSADRTLEDIRAFGEALTRLISVSTAQLAQDLGIDLPGGALPESGPLREDLNNLPGHVQLADEELSRDLPVLFAESLGLELPDAGKVALLAQQLEEFEREARSKITERLEWEQRVAANAKMDLLLRAAAHFSAGASSCPVCSQELAGSPQVRETLEGLRSAAGRLHLHQAVADLERSLLAELDGFLPPQMRAVPEKELGERIRTDWASLKDRRFPALLRAVAERFDAAVAEVAAGCPRRSDDSSAPLGGGFERLAKALAAARRFLGFVRGAQESAGQNFALLTRCLKAEQTNGAPSLLMVLRRGRANNEQLRPLEALRSVARTLYKDERRRVGVAAQADRFRQVATAAAPLKALGRVVREAVIDVMKSVEPRMRTYYRNLHGDDQLPFDLVTTGHAANATIKNELNVYLRAGEERVPAGPFANAGRLRALTLCFLFALLERSAGSLSFLLLDDPALTLDDEHKARLLEYLVRPYLDGHQILLATHSETFFKQAVRTFTGAERLQLVPRRTASDAVAFEPGGGG